MSRYDDLMSRIAAGEKILIDGATGTEMERRGVPGHDNGWFGGAALSHPDVLRAVHAEYIDMGANVVISNTFGTHMGVLRDAGAESDFEELNRLSVELAVEARDAGGRPEVVVAAGISHWSWIGEDPPLDQLERDATEQLRIMADAGAELIILEMMVSIERMLRLITAAKTTGLPIWVGFSVGEEDGSIPDPHVMTLRSNEPLADAIDALAGLGVDLINIMHTDVTHIDACLDVMMERWPGPIGVYAHSWAGIDPADYAARSERWLERGVNLVGGCCGTVPEHIVELAKIELLR
jgi:homocysteine S-methyltransferase